MSGLQDAVDGLFARYAMAIDDDRLEDWLELFAEDCRYRIAARDNVEAGLPVSVVYADGRAMLADRVAALRRANVFEAQRYRHVVGRALVEAGPPVSPRAPATMWRASCARATSCCSAPANTAPSSTGTFAFGR